MRNFVIEIKRKREIGREVVEEVERKLKKLSMPRGKSARTALVYDGDLAPIVEADGYFDAIIPFRELLGLRPWMNRSILAVKRLHK